MKFCCKICKSKAILITDVMILASKNVDKKEKISSTAFSFYDAYK